MTSFRIFGSMVDWETFCLMCDAIFQTPQLATSSHFLGAANPTPEQDSNSLDSKARVECSPCLKGLRFRVSFTDVESFYVSILGLQISSLLRSDSAAFSGIFISL